MATSFATFAFELPLYAEQDISGNLELRAILYNKASARIDGFCPNCGKQSTFFRSSGTNWNLKLDDRKQLVEDARGYYSCDITCARNSSHVINFYYHLGDGTVEKVGQHPSLADIANDEAATYRNILSKEDAAEFHKAIGLAAHGVGIGSFVYLRRIFERLIFNRFEEFKDGEGWVEEEFLKKRMDEKVQFLKGHIPEFLFENRSVYSILSRGIHELSEETCLRAFDFLKLSIKIILEEDKRKQEELKLRKLAAEAIQGFNANN